VKLGTDAAGKKMKKKEKKKEKGKRKGKKEVRSTEGKEED
jgi:hypothetical protein